MISHPFLSQRPHRTTGGFIKDAWQEKVESGEIVLTWLTVGSLARSIWKTGGGKVCWSTESSCWGWPHTAMALVRWSTPFSNSPVSQRGKNTLHREELCCNENLMMSLCVFVLLSQLTLSQQLLSQLDFLQEEFLHRFSVLQVRELEPKKDVTYAPTWSQCRAELPVVFKGSRSSYPCQSRLAIRNLLLSPTCETKLALGP